MVIIGLVAGQRVADGDGLDWVQVDPIEKWKGFDQPWRKKITVDQRSFDDRWVDVHTIQTK